MATTKKKTRSAKRRRPIKTRARRRAKQRRTKPRRHSVRASLDNFELAKARSSLRLQIYAVGDKIGELEIGRGSLYWTGRSKHRSKRLDWSKFAEMMDELAYGVRRSVSA
jgi:hypothetical protein